MPIRLLRHLAQERMPLLLARAQGRRGAVHLVRDHEFGTELQKLVAVAVGLHEVDARHLDGEVLVEAPAERGLPLELPYGSRADHHGLEVELLREFLGPLLAEVRGAEHAKALDLPAVEEFSAR
ncbi:MAG: hypothetical protein KatS3mg102_0354 [Planctomycetota bacterium]|nr:MAG: hypothetical protein KatS3mg102_0354 [Planctomycetota bacterium]